MYSSNFYTFKNTNTYLLRSYNNLLEHSCTSKEGKYLIYTYASFFSLF